MDKKEELMKVKGFIEDSESDGWVNLTNRVWASRDVISGHSLSELAERIQVDVPLSEFHFYTAQPLSQAACADMLKRVKALDAKPVTHMWCEDESAVSQT
jgi:hypothetical protein